MSLEDWVVRSASLFQAGSVGILYNSENTLINEFYCIINVNIRTLHDNHSDSLNNHSVIRLP